MAFSSPFFCYLWRYENVFFTFYGVDIKRFTIFANHNLFVLW